MVAKKNSKSSLSQLKKQVRALAKKEEEGRAKLHSALTKARKMGKVYKTKLTRKVRDMQGKLSKVQASTYAKVAREIQDQLLKSIETKARAIVAALSKIEKKYVSKLSKTVKNQGRKKTSTARKAKVGKSSKKKRTKT